MLKKTVTLSSSSRVKAATGTVDLSLDILEFLVANRRPLGITDLAKNFGSSKATIYRHIQALVKHGFARQDEETLRYEAGIKLFILGEMLRERFNILGVARKHMQVLRAMTGQAISISTLVNDELIALELLQGHTIIDFGVKAGTKLDLHASAHGKVALAFGPDHLMDACCSKTFKLWTKSTIKTPADLKKAVKLVRKNGWATAANEIVDGVNAIASPVFDHAGKYAGAIAIIGSTGLISAKPKPELVSMVITAAFEISKALGNKDLKIKGDFS